MLSGFCIIVLNVAGVLTPFLFQDHKAACQAWHSAPLTSAPNKTAWKIIEDENGFAKRKRIYCGDPVVVTPPAPAPYTDYPATEE